MNAKIESMHTTFVANLSERRANEWLLSNMRRRIGTIFLYCSSKQIFQITSIVKNRKREGLDDVFFGYFIREVIKVFRVISLKCLG